MSELTKTPSPINPTRPRPRYGLVFIFLIFFTAIEVGTSYIQSNLKIPALIVISIIKATLVVLYFMHLRFDSRLYAILFILGLSLLVPLLLILTIAMPALK